MKIVVISSFGPSLINFRGALLHALVSAGHRVLACAPDLDNEVKARLSGLGVECSLVRLSRTGTNPIQDVTTLIDLYKIMRDFQPDLVFGYTAKPIIYGSLAGWLAKVPNTYSMLTGLGSIFVDVQPANSLNVKRKLMLLLAWFLYFISLRQNKLVFFQNPDDLAVFVRARLIRRSRAVVVNGSGVDLDFYAYQAQTRLEPIFLLAARLIADKGIREYVEAARILKLRYPAARFLLIGPKDSNPTAIGYEEIDRWVEQGTIEYCGETSDIRPFLVECTVFVLPSYREGTPRTVLEAMAIGRPIITTHAPGCRETVVHGKNGFLVPIRDIQALVTAMEAFICRPELTMSMGKHSREIASQKYDVHKVNAVIMKSMGLDNNEVSSDEILV